MRSQGAAHRVKVNRDAGGHNDRLRMKIGQAAGRSIDDENADKQDDGGHRTGLRAVIATGHPHRTHGIALDDG